MQSANSASVTGQGKRFLRRVDAAAYVTDHYGFPCSRQWLAKLAVVGGGPVFRKAGRYPIYHPADLDRWAPRVLGRRNARLPRALMKRIRKPVGGERWKYAIPTRSKCSLVCIGT